MEIIMKILFFGDSITDMGRSMKETEPSSIWSYGSGYPMFVASSLYREDPLKYEVINRGISGHRIVDLYARVKKDVWVEKPDVLSILIGINDLWHEFNNENGVEIDRFEKVYRMLIEDTKKELPEVKIILCEPFVLKGSATEEHYDGFLKVYDYARVVKKIAEEYGCRFLPLQEKFNEAAKKHGVTSYLYDGVHPMVAGATLIADTWLELFKNEVE